MVKNRKTKKSSLLLAAIIFLSPPLFSFELDKAAIADGGKSVRSDEERAASPVITKVIQKTYSRADTGLGLAQTNLGEGDVWFRVYKNMSIYAVNVGNEKLVGVWPLTRWPHDHTEPELTDIFKEYGLEPRERKLNVLSEYHLGNDLGCYPLTPLRYGDINGDGNKALVIFIGYDLLVFSPEQEQVIFGQTLRQNEWLSREETDRYYEHYGRSGDSLPQYQLRYLSGLSGTRQGQVGPGLRGYSKLYFNDFDADGESDILVWRKLYESRLRNDEVDGFQHVRDTFLHYKSVEGEYQPQDTKEDVIQDWLAANDLTWQSGYPSKSECEGEEGELIPEMHDPLLNDPDVLE